MIRTVLAVILFVMVLSPYVKAQRVQVSAFIGGIVLAGGTKGIDVKVGSDNPIWNVNGGVSMQWEKANVEHFGKPDETVNQMYGLPYVEGSVYRIVGIGFSLWI